MYTASARPLGPAGCGRAHGVGARVQQDGPGARARAVSRCNAVATYICNATASVAALQHTPCNLQQDGPPVGAAARSGLAVSHGRSGRKRVSSAPKQHLLHHTPYDAQQDASRNGREGICSARSSASWTASLCPSGDSSLARAPESDSLRESSGPLVRKNEKSDDRLQYPHI